MKAGMVWNTRPQDALKALTTAYIAQIRIAVRRLAAYYAAVIEDWMKRNASWTDRTGNARQTLSAEVEDLAQGMVSILLAGGVDYFVYLELGHAGRFAIIGPALDTFGPRIWSDVRALLA